MSITNELQRISQAKTDLKSAIEKRGGVVHEKATLDYYPDVLNNCTCVAKGVFIPEEDTNIFSVSGLPFVPDYFSFVCPDECVDTSNKGVVVIGASTRGLRGSLIYKNASGSTVNVFVKPESTVYNWYADSFTVTISSNMSIYFKKGLAYHYVISGELDPNRHAEYFTITDDGEISLKPDVEIPANLVIPEVVNSIAVERLSTGMFMNNKTIEVLTIPSTIDEIPASFCNNAWNLKRLNNTGHIVKVGEKAFLSCKLERVMMPNLEQLGAQAFGRNANLVYADIGRVSTIEESAFRNDIALVEVESDNAITNVGEGAFSCTWNLKDLNLSSDLNSIGNYGFLRSALDYDWGSLTNCTFGEKATSLQVNPVDFWSNISPTPCENPIPTQLCQHDTRWADENIGQTDVKYRKGCLLFSLIHAYCGIKNLTIFSAFEFEAIANAVSPDLLSGFDQEYDTAANILNNLGVNATFVASEGIRWKENTLSELYQTLNEGGYALVSVQTSEMGHAVLVYGVNEKGELLFLDSNGFYSYDYSKPAKGKLKVQQLIADKREFVIVRNI